MKSIIICLTLLLSGCQTAPVKLNLTHMYNLPKAADISARCQIKLLPVIDIRSNKETLGTTGGVPVLANNVIA